MYERLRILRAMAELQEFTAKTLAEQADVKQATARTVINRDKDLLEEVRAVETGRPGGRFTLYRLNGPGRLKIERELEEIRVPPIPVSSRGEELPASLLAAEEILLAYPSADPRDQHGAPDLAELALSETEEWIRNRDAGRELRALQNLVTFLRDLLLAELAVDGWVHRDAVRALLPRYADLGEQLEGEFDERWLALRRRVEEASPLGSFIAPEVALFAEAASSATSSIEPPSTVVAGEMESIFEESKVRFQRHPWPVKSPIMLSFSGPTRIELAVLVADSVSESQIRRFTADYDAEKFVFIGRQEADPALSQAALSHRGVFISYAAANRAALKGLLERDLPGTNRTTVTLRAYKPDGRKRHANGSSQPLRGS